MGERLVSLAAQAGSDRLRSAAWSHNIQSKWTRGGKWWISRVEDWSHV